MVEQPAASVSFQAIAIHHAHPDHADAFLDFAKRTTFSVAPPDVNARFIAPFVADGKNVNNWLAGGNSLWYQTKGFAIRSGGEWSKAYTFKNGRTEQSNFDTFEMLRIDAAPKEINVHLLPASDYSLPLGGVGEPGVPPVAPGEVDICSKFDVVPAFGPCGDPDEVVAAVVIHLMGVIIISHVECTYRTSDTKAGQSTANGTRVVDTG